ncbi:MAG TPA: sigma-70 family RNA polymerase sigma factor [Myxococcales bacterium]|nr:sigma-70 family RNA polymerase sigma factor [Myxococcales bacterium]HIK85261.1 sigma-70 family RNA polymerase sigma factor [Myxococcales bacterium]
MDPTDKRPDNSLDGARAAGSVDSSDVASVDASNEESLDASNLMSEVENDADLTDSSDLTDDAAGAEHSILPVPVDPQSRLPETGEGRAQATALSAYMSELRHHAPITRGEEHELAVRWTEDGDVDAAKLLVVSNLRLVVKIAMEYRRAWANTLDLIQEGNVGLMEAVQRFDPYKGVKLSSYAVYWIRAYILKYILDNMRSVRLGTTRASRKLFFRLNKEKRELERLGYDVEPQLLAERLDVTEDDVIDMEARLSRPDLSFDAPLRSDEGDGVTFGDRMAAPGISSEAMLGNSELREVFLGKVEAFAETLGERDLIILRSRILADEPRTLAELGEEFDVSRERVRQLEVKIVDRLRTFMKENLVDFGFYEPGGGA